MPQTKKKVAGVKVKAAAKKKAAASSSHRGRSSGMFGGKKIKKLAKDNPFREGSIIAESYKKIMKDGQTYEQYLAAGGRRIDLADAVKYGHVKMVK